MINYKEECVCCFGRGYYEDIEKNGGPYAKNQYYKRICPKCNGSGKIVYNFCCNDFKSMVLRESFFNYEDDFYISPGGSTPIKFCPFCGKILMEGKNERKQNNSL